MLNKWTSLLALCRVCWWDQFSNSTHIRMQYSWDINRSVLILEVLQYCNHSPNVKAK
jgi:hypothetical protein